MNVHCLYKNILKSFDIAPFREKIVDYLLVERHNTGREESYIASHTLVSTPKRGRCPYARPQLLLMLDGKRLQ